MSDLGHPLTRGWHELCIDLVAGKMITEHLIPDLTHLEENYKDLNGHPIHRIV